MDAGTLILNSSSASIHYDIVAKHPITFEVEINGQTVKVENSKYTSTSWNNKEVTSIPAGKYNLKTRVTFDGITRESVQNVYMTGLPMKSINESDWNITSGSISDGKIKLTNDASAELKCMTPTDINVKYDLQTYVRGHHATKYDYTYSIIIGDFKDSKTISGIGNRDEYFFSSGDAVWKANSPIKMIGDVGHIDNADPAYTEITKLSILYR
jgi:hypothetical protein